VSERERGGKEGGMEGERGVEEESGGGGGRRELPVIELHVNKLSQ
jgi:hypothetical protein